MPQIVQTLITIIKAFPVLETILMDLFREFMAQRHKIDVSKFIDAELKARKTKSTDELRKIIGRKLR